jgi:cell division septation protein DedD
LNPAPVLVKNPAPPKATSTPTPAPTPAKSLVGPAISGGGYTLQVAALTKESDALDLAKLLQKKKFPAFVISPKGDKYYRVQVGPYADQKTADAARKGLDSAGFKAIVKH